MKSISVLGSTGSIGKNVLEIVRCFPDRYRIVGLAAGSSIDSLAAQVLEFSPELVSVANQELADELRQKLLPEYSDRVVSGEEGCCAVARLESADMVMSAVVGGAGLLPTLAAIDAGKDIGLANKETLVMAGRIVMNRVREKGVQLLPVDSEHSAIFQSLEAGRRQDVKKIILTASGGPFRKRSKEEMQAVTVEQALNHPNWSMGQKITIDSATLMNKGLEVIEARWLFDVAVPEIDVVIHPQSIVHSLVEYRDGSVIAQLGLPDMKIPIAYALSYPERMELDLPSLNLATCQNLEFFSPDLEIFPALRLAFDALGQGGVMPAVLNGANEVAVAAFLERKIGFSQIVETVSKTMDIVQQGSEESLDDILAADSQARIEASRIIEH